MRIKEANCKNCYKCVRVCPVKAIKISNAQAEVDAERCIACGNCLIACPQKAKEIVSERTAVASLLQGTLPVVASVAPSLVAAWPGASAGQVVTALELLGFASVSQTSAGAAIVSRAYDRLLAKGRVRSNPWLTTACPAVVSLVERYYPDLASFLAPVATPLIAHARLIKAMQPKARVVFIGPCLAKKNEAARPDNAGLVDGVLTFGEVAEWLQEAGIVVSQLPESPWSELDQEVAALYPVSGGLLQHLQQQGAAVQVADGLEEVLDVLEGMRHDGLRSALVECNACRGACINGPCMPATESQAKRRERVREYHQARKSVVRQPRELPLVSTEASYAPDPIRQRRYSDAEIQHVLDQIGKTSPEAELNCSACGYATCREKAIAVLDGRAELDMCMPYMRSRAESLAYEIFESTPNALIVVDRNMIIRDLNTAAERMFARKMEQMKGSLLSDIIPDEDFRAVAENGSWITGKRVAYPNLGIITTQTIRPLEGQEMVLGVIGDVTRLELQDRELSRVREETLSKAQVVIDKQMRVAQEIAGLLGEVTADSKVLLMQLMRLVQGEEQGR
ncbi:MAG: [Fe-Fe] hydrogenase large subunit C-terminal domain-containing protein [Bacillota bacterium]